MPKTKIIQGEIVLPTGNVPAEPVDVVIYVEDVSRADAPSIVVGMQRQHGVLLHAGSMVQFVVEIPVELVDQRRSYSVRAHIDVSGSGEVKVGDFVSTQTYPVLTHGHGTSVYVSVKRV
ncbi:YbaY family lipoprotein [Candidatus Nitrospira neomarina]|uniref:YbaY family lipoprotein n=1 Tax=Candidatus Nitrospira neomarina TaxID=3020899 RepID=A0AA96GK91_9BACT|nr:YbaY family lipoprotein [Candidatus Nitrospira neomarina]WNM61900.1 YbaY family lipoprotein [Candidatus Nitrospira neomarina]